MTSCLHEHTTYAMCSYLLVCAGDIMPLSLVQGYTIALSEHESQPSRLPPDLPGCTVHASPQTGELEHPAPSHTAPAMSDGQSLNSASVLGSPYMARQGAQLIIGATKDYGYSASQACVPLMPWLRCKIGHATWRR